MQFRWKYEHKIYMLITLSISTSRYLYSIGLVDFIELVDFWKIIPWIIFWAVVLLKEVHWTYPKNPLKCNYRILLVTLLSLNIYLINCHVAVAVIILIYEGYLAMKSAYGEMSFEDADARYTVLFTSVIILTVLTFVIVMVGPSFPL